MKSYNPQKIERKWREFWEKKGVFRIDLKKAKKPYYNLMMFPYPSAEGLHVGNVYAFTGSDIHGRFKRMQGYDVFEPMGFDAFGIHSENFAIKKGIHPKILIKKNTDNFRRQLKSLGCLFDWRYEVDTTKPDYYKWTQWLFLQLFKAGLAYRKTAPVDWCPSCKTVLADEQVIQGKCERCDSQVAQKELEQWFFKITKYAEKLLKNLNWIDWSERTKITQRNWIGKSEGALIKFKVKSEKLKIDDEIEVFTTRPDTLFGATYLVAAPEYPLIENWKLKIKNWREVKIYIEKARKKSELERTGLTKEKTGVELRGPKALNPATKEEIPIFIADYVLAGYGTGAIMAVPAHDQRDFEFAQKYNLPIKIVICPKYPQPVCPILDKACENEGYLVGSGKFNGLTSEKAKKEITKFVGGKRTINYHLRDWLISRQRYWGPPIPVIYCKKCGIVAVPEKDLPVLLPYVKKFRPKGTGQSPLASVKNFVNTKCPKCKGPAQRETDVSDTFLDSAWYFLRYPSVRSARSGQVPFDPEITRRWLPVDMYIGGQEHAVLHLMYSRFITMVLKDLGFIDFSARGGSAVGGEEPFKKFRAHGLITKGGAKMSKSKGNVVNPDEYYKKYGADALRLYLMFIGPFSEGGDWQDRGVIGIERFLEKIWKYVSINIGKLDLVDSSYDKTERLLNKTIKKVTNDIENLKFNTAISSLMELINFLVEEYYDKGVKFAERYTFIKKEDLQKFLIILSPFAPHIAEELWQGLKPDVKPLDSIHNQKWPKYDEKLVEEETITLIIQVNGRVRDKIEVKTDILKEEARQLAISSEKVQNWIAGKKIKKTIFVPGKLINIVV